MTNCFPLTRYLTATSLVAFGVVAATLMYFEHRQSNFFQSVQSGWAQMLTSIQSDFVTPADAVARRDLLAVNEQGNLNLTRLFSNALWVSELSPYLADSGTVDFSLCKAMPDAVDAKGKTNHTHEKKACFKETATRLKALASFAPLDDSVVIGRLISESQIYRFISKPAGPEYLNRTLRSALTRHRQLLAVPERASRHRAQVSEDLDFELDFASASSQVSAATRKPITGARAWLQRLFG